MKYQNPVIKGYHPDPSIIRVGEDYYLATSSFEFFPGVPIFHSQNLADWTLIGHCLTTDTQARLTEAENSGGIYAPTLRVHKGTFYMITTNVSSGGNFIVQAPKISEVRGVSRYILTMRASIRLCCLTERRCTSPLLTMPVLPCMRSTPIPANC